MKTEPTADELIDLQPTLIGSRVIVRPLIPNDFSALFAVAADPKIWEQHPENERYKKPVFQEYFSTALSSGSAFAIVDKVTERIIGSSRYHGHDAAAGEIEIGWTFLARQYWGGAYNREVKALMINHIFRFVPTVIFWVGVNNLRSRKAMEKIGATLRDGTHSRQATSSARDVIYEINRP